jgi:hypothetical protein
MMQNRNLRASFRAASAYYNGLQRHKVPEDDARLAGARELVSRNERRYNWTSGAQAQTQTGSDQGVDQDAEHETEHESQDPTEPGYEQVDQSVSAMT